MRRNDGMRNDIRRVLRPIGVRARMATMKVLKVIRDLSPRPCPLLVWWVKYVLQCFGYELVSDSRGQSCLYVLHVHPLLQVFAFILDDRGNLFDGWLWLSSARVNWDDFGADWNARPSMLDPHHILAARLVLSFVFGAVVLVLLAGRLDSFDESTFESRMSYDSLFGVAFAQKP